MRRLILVMVCTVIMSPYAQDWGLFATVSSTLGVQGDRLCIGESSRGDIGCPTYAPALNAAGHVTVPGNLTTTGILSGNTVAGGMVATQAEAEAGTNNDHIMTPLRVLQAITKALSTAPTVPTGAIMAFDLSSCPSGWTEYTPARGRFLRGVDNGAGNDPDGTRTIGATQGDMFASHTHTAYAPVNDRNDAATQGWPVDNIHNTFRTSDRTRDVAVQSQAIGQSGGAETRPKNVAVLYCRKS